jgi:hypothetical protein
MNDILHQKPFGATSDQKETHVNFQINRDCHSVITENFYLNTINQTSLSFFKEKQINNLG